MAAPPRYKPIAISGKQRKAADRVGGTLLILPWPPGLPDGNRGEPLRLDDERDASAVERAAAEEIVGPACRAMGLVPVRVIVQMLRLGDGSVAQRLAVLLIGSRWVHARTSRVPSVSWHDAPIERA